MKIVVTGGAGFIGSNFIFYMLRNYPDYVIICLDKLTYAGCKETLSPLSPNANFHFIKLDICDRQGVASTFEAFHPDIIVNFAAESHVDRSIHDPSIFLHTNITGTAVLMDACLKYGIKRFHQVSTDEVYGDLPYDRPAPAFTEASPLKPSSPYSASKASADLLVMAYRKTYGLPVSISRCSNNYGYYQFPEKFIPLMITNLLSQKAIPVYGKGLNIRDWIFVEDHCRAIDEIIHRGSEGEIYNIGSRQEMRNIELAELVCQEMHMPKTMITYVADRQGHDRRYAINPDKISRELGWQPKIGFTEGISKTIQWYKENRAWWTSVSAKQ